MENQTPSRDILLEDVQAFLEEFKSRRMNPTRFGVEAAGDRNFVERLKNGADLTTAKYDQVRRYMDLKRREFAARAAV